MNSKQMAKKLFDEKMCEVHELIPENILPFGFLTQAGQLRSVIMNEHLGIYYDRVVKALRKEGYKVICGEDALLVEFDP